MTLDPPSRAQAVWIVASASIMMAMTAPAQTVAVSVFVDPMIDGLRISRSQISGAYLVGTLSGAAVLPWVGRLIDRIGVRRASLFAALLFGFLLVLMSGVTGLVTLTLGFAGIRLLGQGSLSLASTTSVALWFERRRGLAIGITTAVGAAGISLAPLAISALIRGTDWRFTWIVLGVTAWAVLLPVAWFLRDAPRRSPPAQAPDLRDNPADGQAASGWTRAEAMRTLMFWSIAAAVGTTAMVTTGIAFHQISLLGERGLSVTEAAVNFLPQTAAAIVVSFGMGALVDRFAPRLLIVAAMAFLGGALVLAQVARPGLLAIAFGVAAGSSAGALKALEAAIVPRFFGLEHVGSIRGTILALQVGASAYGPTVLAFGFDRSGSYGPVLSLLLALPIAVSILILFARVPDAALLSHIRSLRPED